MVHRRLLSPVNERVNNVKFANLIREYTWKVDLLQELTLARKTTVIVRSYVYLHQEPVCASALTVTSWLRIVKHVMVNYAKAVMTLPSRRY